MRGADAKGVSEKQRQTFKKDSHIVIGAMRKQDMEPWVDEMGIHIVIKVRERVPEGVITRQDWAHSWGRGIEAGGSWYKKREKGTSKAGDYKRT